MRSTDQTLAILAILAIAIAPGCVEREGRTGNRAADSIADTTMVVRGRLPQGRFELPTPLSGVPHLFITLPEGYTVRPTGVGTSDQFFIVASDDPSLIDTTVITPAFMQIYVGINEQKAMTTGSWTERPVVIAGRPAVWRVWNEPLPDGSRYHVREIASREFFSLMSRELSHRRPELHVYIAGRDSNRVERLVTAAGSIHVTP